MTHLWPAKATDCSKTSLVREIGINKEWKYFCRSILITILLIECYRTFNQWCFKAMPAWSAPLYLGSQIPFKDLQMLTYHDPRLHVASKMEVLMDGHMPTELSTGSQQSCDLRANLTSTFATTTGSA